jgi:16S rRNA (guanine527-N7)-methyltransferase
MMDDSGALDVSRETMDRFKTYADLLAKWNPKINLVSKSSLGDLWSRHMADSAQIFEHRPPNVTRWIDIGSGGGFPGLVIAIRAFEKQPDLKVTLVESDTRKCAFLRTVVRETGIDANVVADRIENVVNQKFDVLSARALASLDVLCGYAEQLLSDEGTALLLKGETWNTEMSQAEKRYDFECETFPSNTQENGVILKLRNIRHV